MIWNALKQRIVGAREIIAKQQQTDGNSATSSSSPSSSVNREQLVKIKDEIYSLLKVE